MFSPETEKLIKRNVIVSRIVWFFIILINSLDAVLLCQLVKDNSGLEMHSDAEPLTKILPIISVILLIIALAIEKILFSKYFVGKILRDPLDQSLNRQTFLSMFWRIRLFRKYYSHDEIEKIKLLPEIDQIAVRLSNRWTTRNLIFFVLIQSVVVHGFLLSILNQTYVYCFTFSGAALILLLLNYPRTESLYKKSVRFKNMKWNIS